MNESDNLALLEPFERFSFRVARFCNRRLKRVLTFYQQTVLGIVFEFCSGRVVRPHGLEHAQAIPKDAPILLVSNHRTFFDFFGLLTILYKRGGIGRYIYFPVRSTFFYERVLGLIVNALVGAWSMYPPIFRERGKLTFNRFSMEETARLLQEPGSLVGIHPEGTRNKGPSPYTLLPAQPGVGRVAMQARPTVLPVFILGTENNFWKQIKNNWITGEPIFAVFGPPIDLSDLYALGDRPAIHKLIADRMRETIAALGEQERKLRAAAGFAPKGEPGKSPAPGSNRDGPGRANGF